MTCLYPGVEKGVEIFEEAALLLLTADRRSWNDTLPLTTWQISLLQLPKERSVHHFCEIETYVLTMRHVMITYLRGRHNFSGLYMFFLFYFIEV